MAEEIKQPIFLEEKKKKNGWLTLITVLGLLLITLLIVVILWKIGAFGSTKNTLYIAVAGPMSGKSEANGLAMKNGIQICLDEINESGGIEGHPIELLVFDDQNQSKQAQNVALKIAQESQALAVIGHYSSSTSLVAGPLYQKYNIPAISSTATADDLTLSNDWYFRTTFKNSDQGALIANYAYKVLGYKKANILFDEDAYGVNLADAFTKTAKMIGLKIENQWSFNTETGNFEKMLKKLIKTLTLSPDPNQVLFLATHSSEAVETISTIKDLDNLVVPMIGADALGSTAFAKKIQQYPQEQAQPGYYTNGIYSTGPLIFDLTGKNLQTFRFNYVKKYQESPHMTSALYYDATLVVLDGLKKMLQQKTATTLKEQRQQIKENLQKISKIDQAIEGLTGSLYFDEKGDIVKPVGFYLHKNGAPVIALRQFQLLQSLNNVENLLQKALKNELIEVNGQFMSLVHVVYIGIDFTDLSELDIQDASFNADFYLWFRYKGDFEDSNIEFINLFGQPLNLLEPVLVWHSKVEEGITTRTYRVRAQFKVEFDFHNYPLDQQILPIALRHKELTRKQLVYVVDIQGMDLNRTGQSNFKSAKFFSIGGWSINNLLFFQNTKVTDSTLGIPEFFGNKQRIEYSQFNATITINRDLLNFILKTLLPVIFLLVIGYISLFIKNFSSKLGISTNLIVATSLFHLRLASDLPNVSYIVLIDYFFYLIYILAIFTIVLTVLNHLYEESAEKGNQIFINRLNLLGKIIYPLVLAVFVGFIVYGNYDLIFLAK